VGERVQLQRGAIVLRPATPRDRAFAQRTYFETQRWLIERLFGWRGDEVERAKFDEFYDERHTRIVEVDGAAVGWLTVMRERDRIELDSIYIASAKQNAGLGTHLITELIAQAQAARKKLTLSTAKINPARRLYERLGFAVTAESEFKVQMEHSQAHLVIRERTDSDLASCLAALRTVHETDGYPSSWPQDPSSWLTPEGLVQAWVAAFDSSVVGHIALGTIDPVESPHFVTRQGENVEIMRLFVVPNARGRGVAQKLLDTAVAFARAQGRCPVLEVTVDRRAAVALYERVGWRRIGSAPAGWVRASGERPLVHHYVFDNGR
jgi:ribosomal protein S18 acetylase RimI-like enzyme